jgi:hypothetical protein
MGSIALFAIVFASTAPGSAQESRRSAEVRSLGDRLLRALGEFQSVDVAERSTLRSDTSALIRRRAAALAALVEEDPAVALRLALPPDVTARLWAAFPAGAAQIESHGTWEGPIEYIIEDGLNFATHRSHRIISVGGEALRVHFAGVEHDLKSGDVLRVSGVRAGNVLAASEGSIVTAAAVSSPQECSTIGAQKTIVLLVTMPGVAAPADITVPDVSDTFFSPNQRSLSEYWRENSYGQTWAEGDAKGWYTLDRTYSCEPFSELEAMRAAAIAAAAAT